MEQKYKAVIQSNFQALVDEIKGDPLRVAIHLFGNNAINENMKHEIQGEVTPQAKANKLLDLVMTKHQAYHHLIEACRDAEMHHSVEILSKGLSEELEEDDIPGNDIAGNVHNCSTSDEDDDSNLSDEGEPEQPPEVVGEEEEQPPEEIEETELQIQFRQHQNFVTDHRLPLSLDDYINLSAIEMVAGKNSGGAQQVLETLVMFRVIVERMCEEEIERLRQDEYTAEAAMEKFIEKTRLEDPEEDKKFFYVVKPLPDNETQECLLTLNSECISLKDFNMQMILEYPVDCLTECYSKTFWDCHMKFNDGVRLKMLTQESEDIQNALRCYQQSSVCNFSNGRSS